MGTEKESQNDHEKMPLHDKGNVNEVNEASDSMPVQENTGMHGDVQPEKDPDARERDAQKWRPGVM